MVFNKLLLSVLLSFAHAQAPPAEFNCTGKLDKIPNNEAVTNIKVSYNAEIPLSVKIGKGWKSFFTTSDDKNCQVKKCVLMDKFCQDPYEGTKVAISESYPW